MKDDIRAVKDSLFDIVDKIVSKTEGLSIRFGIVSYRDHPPQDRTYVTRVYDFTGKIKDVHSEISRLRPSEGGDTPEAVADGLFDARTKLSWDKEAYKVLLLVGDAPPHMDYQDDGYVVQYEPGVNPDGLKQHYKLRPFENRDMYFGAFNIAIKDENGRIEAIADNRRNGATYHS